MIAVTGYVVQCLPFGLPMLWPQIDLPPMTTSTTSSIPAHSEVVPYLSAVCNTVYADDNGACAGHMGAAEARGFAVVREPPMGGSEFFSLPS